MGVATTVANGPIEVDVRDQCHNRSTRRTRSAPDRRQSHPRVQRRAPIWLYAPGRPDGSMPCGGSGGILRPWTVARCSSKQGAAAFERFFPAAMLSHRVMRAAVQRALRVSTAIEQLLLPAEVPALSRPAQPRDAADRLPAVRQRCERWRPPCVSGGGNPSRISGRAVCCPTGRRAHLVRSAVWLDEAPGRPCTVSSTGRIAAESRRLAAAMLPLRPQTDGRSVLIPIPLSSKAFARASYNSERDAGARAGPTVGIPRGRTARPARETPTQRR